ncbi:MAG: hypothetical protein UU37_C0006G0010 [Candidatus Gottesmanbacteria bacterium GW2011_GWA2_41_12]|uniref:Uncharacterized protein n=2 Tax=Candidatus Gottesmaniibacteriota TaxID=1752720 RepID=A0A0G0UHL4_9BACT|nr:MAG: hypothetical protein UT63_C0071G0003 [Candidatus Gottesmanbacteria bacterium GW2011_GWC2_39_8]KKR88323.1 MAG: hypothetical protein UU37_C0006G0010 [Candidatus Gottesmanbacteria bacterium GW2011_GWA2_41_12]
MREQGISRRVLSEIYNSPEKKSVFKTTFGRKARAHLARRYGLTMSEVSQAISPLLVTLSEARILGAMESLVEGKALVASVNKKRNPDRTKK